MARILAPALVLLVAALAGCASPSAPSSTPAAFADIHGVALDPSDPAFVYVATHRGLFRGNEDGFARVGETQNDLMGFSLAGDRAMFASGHPPGGGNLGLLRSGDRGVTWAPIGAAGADFHAMAASPADPNRLYASWRGDVLRSDNAGGSFDVVSRGAFSSFAPHPLERDLVYAANGAAILVSVDAGRTWTPLVETPAIGLAQGQALYAGGAGGVGKSADGGATWTQLTMPAADATYAHLAARNETVVAASYQLGIYRSDDGGATWRTLHEPRG